ncbi:MAG: hypothetical protein Kow0098_02320 [Ignavibacteriaceae bacterium]
MRNLLFILFLAIIQTSVYGQGLLEINPDNIEFEDIFNRLETVQLYNDGNAPLTIDSLAYNKDYYYIRFDGPWTYPFVLNPGDTVNMDCILAGFYIVPSSDTLDTLYVYNSGEDSIEYLRIKIDYYDDDYNFGTIEGQILSNSNPVPDAEVRFFYNGSYWVTSAFTDFQGNFSVALPPGPYLIAAQKDSFYVTFYADQFDPFYAEVVQVAEDSTSTITLELVQMQQTGFSIAGQIVDDVSGLPVPSAVVIRKGTHNPSKPVPESITSLPSDLYTAFTDVNGNFVIHNVIEEDYYFIQAFTDYFIPSYYSDTGSVQFWQQADSVFINTQLTGYNVEVLRDSSYGGGNVTGDVIINTGEFIQPSDVLVYAQNINTGLIYSYTFVSNSGTYNQTFLPYGTYRLIGQRIGIDDAVSEQFTIDPINPVIPDIDLIFNLTDLNEPAISPESIELFQNYPNPFNPSTSISFILPESDNIALNVFNIMGEKVEEIYSGYLPAGRHNFSFDAAELVSGVYIAELRTSGYRKTIKMLLLK